MFTYGNGPGFHTILVKMDGRCPRRPIVRVSVPGPIESKEAGFNLINPDLGLRQPLLANNDNKHI
jgi:hypothetical protein